MRGAITTPTSLLCWLAVLIIIIMLSRGFAIARGADSDWRGGDLLAFLGPPVTRDVFEAQTLPVINTS
jgi:hypothetical protein